MIIRKCEEYDLEAVYSIYRQARDNDYFQEAAAADFQAFTAIVEGEEIFVVAIGCEVIAFISVFPPQSFVHHLYVLPSYQGQGIGKALIEHIRNIFDSPLSLKCESCNEPAIRFYEKMGWNLFDTGSESDGTEYILLTLDFE